MKGLIRKAVTALGPALVAAGLAGCHTCDSGGCGGCNGGDSGNKCCADLYDHCWPQRYFYQAEVSVINALAPQVQNGHVLDQTVWNHHFETGTDKLTPGGQAHLSYLGRRRPCPDTTVYIQTATDLAYDPACPENLAGARQELDKLRVQAVQKYLAAVTAGRQADFQVLVHDPSDPSTSAIPPANAIQQMYLRTRGGLATGGGGGGGGAATVSGGGGVSSGPR
jgi:hypothetical protein